MTSVASPLISPRVHAAVAPSPPARGFAALDERMLAFAPGLLVVRAPSREASVAIGMHVARRAASAGAMVIEARERRGCPLWREVAAKLGVGELPSEPAGAAAAIAHAAILRRAVVVGPLPSSRGWDRAVVMELAALASPPAAVLTATGAGPIDELGLETYEVGAALDEAELARWWSALAQTASGAVTHDDLATLDAWWEGARRAPATRAAVHASLDRAVAELLSSLALADRAWPVKDVTALGADASAVDAAVRASAARSADGWLAIEPAWDERSEALARAAGSDVTERAARALLLHFSDDAWALARAAELLVRVGSSADADAAHARALELAADATTRRHLVGLWADAVAELPEPQQLPLRVRAAERALSVGEAEEAFRWAQSATTLAPDEAALALLFGRTAVALGDLVAARVALDRAAEQAPDGAQRSVIAAEMAEVAYLGGDLAAAAAQADRALSVDASPATRLKARNTLGKLLLAAGRWDQADAHFAQDGWAASSAGLRTEGLRARLNRGIALLSKGFADEAGAIFEGVLTEGERAGDARVCAFAVENLAVVATLRHDYANALSLTERALKLRERIGDRLKTALVLSNLAELRRSLGLLDHAEHAVAFGRRTLGPGMPPAHSAFFSIQAARTALARGRTIEARREATRAIAESEAAGLRNYTCEAACVGARVALEDGDRTRAAELLERARPDATTVELRAELLLVSAAHARALGVEAEATATEALAACRSCGKEDLLIEAHALLGELHRTAGRAELARAHVESAISLRDQIAAALPQDIRAAFLSRPDLAALSALVASVCEPASQGELPASSPSPARPSSRPALAAARELVGEDPAVRGLMLAVRKIARANSTVLIRGESGTGKELVAEAIHRASERAAGPMVTVNCAALVETLLLSELFGHEKGAFTGAIARRRGRFEMAEGGTLFLDEIGDISPRTQVALLRVLQERTFERVGGTTSIRANVRVICATHRDLRGMVERGEFREDLYYRLRGITLEVPPLRARMGDLPRISEHLLARIAAERGEDEKQLSIDALDLLGRHRWPGNVRELENALRAAALFAEGRVITAATLLDNVDDLRGAAGSLRTRAAAPAPSGPLSEEVAGEEDEGLDGSEAPLPAIEASATAVAYSQVRTGSTSLPDIKRQIERDCIARALAETRGNITRAATLLGMKRPRLSQLVKQYGLAAVSSEGS